jgi:hypothetical protein
LPKLLIAVAIILLLPLLLMSPPWDMIWKRSEDLVKEFFLATPLPVLLLSNVLLWCRKALPA